jgi:hypothetical protein
MFGHFGSSRKGSHLPMFTQFNHVWVYFAASRAGVLLRGRAVRASLAQLLEGFATHF